MSGPPGRRLSRDFYRRSVLELAPDLLNKVLVGPDRRAGRIVEVEAYRGADDPGSHAHRGQTPRTEVMFGPPGHLYVYFAYGMHWCANIVGERDGEPGAVLIRALTPLRGLEAMRYARPAARSTRDLCSGPAKLTQALGIDGSFDRADLVSGDQGVCLLDDGTVPPGAPGRDTRVGLSRGGDLRWRWFVEGADDLSRRPRTGGSGSRG